MTIRAAEPHTTTEVLEALNPVDLTQQGVALLHYGERNEPLAAALLARGAILHELCLYEWRPPDDLRPLQTLVRELIDGTIDVLAVTSQIQARHLFDVADALGLGDRLAESLDRRVIVAAIGPVCVSTLRARGVTPRVVPEQARMGLLVTALADYVSKSSAS